MKLSKPQAQRFWREWSAVCRYQGWRMLPPADVEVKRKELIARAGFSSLTEVDRRAGFDRVLAELRALQDDVSAGVETDDPTIGEARRIRSVIANQIVPCLALYEEDANGYVKTVLSGLVRWGKSDRPVRSVTLDDLDAHPVVSQRGSELRESPSQLHQALMTLSARLDAKRRAYGHTIHDMRTAARLPCTCAICRRYSTLEPEPVAKPDNDLVDAPF